MTVGGGGKGIAVLGRLAPRLTDRLMERSYFGLQREPEPPRPRQRNTLDSPSMTLDERGDYEGHVAERSLYTGLSLRRSLVGAAVAGVGAVLYSRSRKARRGAEEAASRDERPAIRVR